MKNVLSYWKHTSHVNHCKALKCAEKVITMKRSQNRSKNSITFIFKGVIATVHVRISCGFLGNFFSIVNAYEIEHRGTALFNFTHTDLSHLWSALECVAIWCSLPRPTIGFVLLFFFFIKICFKKAVVNYTCTPGSNTQFLCRDLFHGYNKSSTDGDTWVANAVCQDAVHHSRVWVNYSRGHKTRNKETQNISNK